MPMDAMDAMDVQRTHLKLKTHGMHEKHGMHAKHEMHDGRIGVTKATTLRLR
jgi:hypothetical protein